MALRSTSSAPQLHFVGFGSQAQAWARCLRESGWQTPIYLSRPEGRSAKVARELGFEDVQPLSELTARLAQISEASSANPALKNSAPPLVAFLCPDAIIGAVYQEHLSQVAGPLTLVLAHGYTIYAGDLKPARPDHEPALLAPKAIGPKIWSNFQQARESAGKPPEGQSPESRYSAVATHRLVAGFHASPARAPQVVALAAAMGFHPERLVEASFEKEAIGDLLSEQGLLCGGVFTLLGWTIEAMQKAGVPAGLIREECLTELELIAGMLRERGPATTFRAISQAAQCGTVLMKQTIEESGLRARFDARLSEVLDGRFAERFRGGEWQAQAENLAARLEQFERELGGPPAGSKVP